MSQSPSLLCVGCRMKLKTVISWIYVILDLTRYHLIDLHADELYSTGTLLVLLFKLCRPPPLAEIANAVAATHPTVTRTGRAAAAEIRRAQRRSSLLPRTPQPCCDSSRLHGRHADAGRVVRPGAAGREGRRATEACACGGDGGGFAIRSLEDDAVARRCCSGRNLFVSISFLLVLVLVLFIVFLIHHLDRQHESCRRD